MYLVCVDCDALLEPWKKAEEGGSQLAGLAPRECPSVWVCGDLGGLSGCGVARVRETIFSAECSATPPPPPQLPACSVPGFLGPFYRDR